MFVSLPASVDYNNPAYDKYHSTGSHIAVS